MVNVTWFLVEKYFENWNLRICGHDFLLRIWNILFLSVLPSFILLILLSRSWIAVWARVVLFLKFHILISDLQFRSLPSLLNFIIATMVEFSSKNDAVWWELLVHIEIYLFHYLNTIIKFHYCYSGGCWIDGIHMILYLHVYVELDASFHT